MQKRKFPPRPKRLRPGYLCVSWSHGPKCAPGLQRETQRQKIGLSKVVRAGISACTVHHPDTPAGRRHSLVLPAFAWKELTPHSGSVITAKSA